MSSQDVLTTIDGAQVDWSVSLDAMRWTPRPEPEQPPTDPDIAASRHGGRR